MEQIVKTVKLNKQAVDVLKDFRSDYFFDSSYDFINEALSFQLYGVDGTGSLTERFVKFNISDLDKDEQCDFILHIYGNFEESDFEYDEDIYELKEFTIVIDPKLAVDIELELMLGYTLSELVSEAICRFDYLIAASNKHYGEVRRFIDEYDDDIEYDDTFDEDED